MDIFAELEKLRKKHYVNDEDCWFSCPKSGECCDEWMIEHSECRCGADEHNETLDGIIEWLKSSQPISVGKGYDNFWRKIEK